MFSVDTLQVCIVKLDRTDSEGEMNMETSMVTAVRLAVDGSASAVELQRSSGGDVGRALRAELECRTFEVVRLAPDLDMWIDEEGLCVAEPVVNAVATRIARLHGFVWQPYVGTVVFASVDADGETQSLSSAQVTTLGTYVLNWGAA